MSVFGKKLACLALVATFTVPGVSQSQPTAAPTGSSASTPNIPIEHLYLHFFLFEAHFEQMEQQHPGTAGRNGGFIDTVRKKTGLNTEEWKSVEASSIRFQEEHQTVSGQIAELVKSDKAKCHASAAICPTPPHLAQVTTLQSNHRQNLENEIASLETTLGPSATAKLRAFLQNDVGVRVRTLTAEQIKAAQQTSKVVTK